MKKVLLYDGREMYVREDDDGISKELGENAHHELESTEFLKTIIEKDMLILDVGANIGYYALLEAELAFEGAVWAVEPVPKNVECLLHNIEQMKVKNIGLLPVAVGAENCVVPMRLASFSNSGTLMDETNTSEWYQEWFSRWYTETIEVEQTTIDSIVRTFETGPPDMIRMDVEGYETKVLYGARETLRLMPAWSYLFIEIHPKVFANRWGDTYNIVSRLFVQGFKPYWVDGELVNFDEPSSFTDYLCNIVEAPHVFFQKVKR